MNKENDKLLSKNILMTKKDLYTSLGYKNMDVIYKKILSEKIVNELGFNSLDEFKKIKQFNLEQTKSLKRFLVELKS